MPEGQRRFGNYSGKNLSLKECKISPCEFSSANKSCAIVVPVYEKVPNKYEQASFINMVQVIDGKYDIILLHGKSFDATWYNDIYKCREMIVDGVFLSSRSTYSDLCESYLFYKTLSEYKYILIFQLDAWIFKNNIQYFVDKGYDYIGSIHSFSKKSFTVGNGGFSLRKVSSFMKVCEECKTKLFPKSFPEDIVFSYCLSKSLKIAPYEVGLKFGFQNSPRELYRKNGNALPMGCHAFTYCDYSWWKNHININAVIKNKENEALNKMSEQLTKQQKDKIISFARRVGASISNPVTITDKLNWLKLYDSIPLKTKCADKLLLHEYAKEKLGKDICPEVLAVYNNPSEIKLEQLPDKFVLKCNHGSGMNIIVSDKSKLNFQKAKLTLSGWLASDFSQRFGEAHYHDIKKKCYAEKYYGGDLKDYKFWCFNGVPKFFSIGSGGGHGAINHYDFEGNYLPGLSRIEYPSNPNKKYEMPKNLQEMIEYSKILSAGFLFVRVDFYEVEGKTILGEMTFIPGAGSVKYKDSKYNKIVGSYLHLPIKEKNRYVIYTCVTGNYESIPKLSKTSSNFDYVCYTDQNVADPVWDIRPIPEKLSKLSNSLKNRYIKLHPHEFFKEYELSIYIDGNVDIVGDVNEYIKKECTEGYVLFAGKHPARNCIYEEAEAVVKLKKDTAEHVTPQMNKYEKEGFPKHFGLTQNCIIIRYHNDPKCIETMNAWWEEVKTESYRDQLSLFYAIWKTKNDKYKILPGDIFKNDYFIWGRTHKKTAAKRNTVQADKLTEVKKEKEQVPESKPVIDSLAMSSRVKPAVVKPTIKKTYGRIRQPKSKSLRVLMGMI